ncbi:MAG: hypothetical protein KQA41_03685 [Candidatus Aenigmarchaeota archaeon]|nr:hypothetical protein [Candidatus Aenigmarchaeota archaeon]
MRKEPDLAKLNLEYKKIREDPKVLLRWVLCISKLSPEEARFYAQQIVRGIASSLDKKIVKKPEDIFPKISDDLNIGTEKGFPNINYRDLLMGIAESVFFLLKEKQLDTEKPFSGWGCPSVTTGVYGGPFSLWYTNASGDVVVKGPNSGWYSIFTDEAVAEGPNSGWYSIYEKRAKALGPNSGWYSEKNNKI